MKCMNLGVNAMSEQYPMSEQEQSDACADAWSAIALVAIIVTTAAFWLLGR